MTAAVLAVTGLSGGYGRTAVLRNVDVEVHEGEIVTLLGANGAGKSTLLNAILGLLPQLQGHVAFHGRELVGMSTERIVRLGIGLVPERRQLFGSMTVEENLMLGAFIDPRRTSEGIATQYARFPILGERRRQLAGTMSGGQQQMLAIARALMSSPRLLLLDEPSLGLAPLVVRQIFRVVQEIRDAGSTVLLVEQNANAALRIADRAYVMKTGQIVDHGDAAALLADDAVAEAYLGGRVGGDSMESRLRAKAVALRGRMRASN